MGNFGGHPEKSIHVMQLYFAKSDNYGFKSLTNFDSMQSWFRDTGTSVL